MRRDDRDEPFDDLFREIERMMNEMMSGADVDFDSSSAVDSGFGMDTHVDIHETDDEIRVVADLPGVEKDNIDLECDGKTLTISAQSDHRQYDERVSLPQRVNEHSASATYNNGVLEVVFESAEHSSGISLE
ncbi:Hsp20/alpha crystallin family protein [Natronococcus sp. A-GB1]|jgi:HSP20 family protein|uniref:Heat shock protein Hsp20 n=1 Tax=Natronococcus amylolyticus DSM 10524 TaxID=1227497 RepID=L9XCA3_9EURY|nr:MULTISPECIES: Hsp20/alpha crystallin family protein [Natronococcus]ELY59365.1 heat shock protein Hsp20 [Natronococcus amylolyticus DSM 10524]MDG5757807.1 Hsp20/alpha crystallin family protein [Natronococcus sp. A-GB1]MDG5820044.1 Hsp20/alpha crystallin family protein [Natronococcus sp. A-GB7]